MKRGTQKLIGVLIIILFIFVWQNRTTAPKSPRHTFGRANNSTRLFVPGATTTLPADATEAEVARVIDGDTIVLASGQKVRYIGMDTPETHDPRKPVQCFGVEAAEYNRGLVDSKIVRLVKDVSETDRYGRLLRYVYLEDGTFVNLKLVQDGYARVFTLAPDVLHAPDFLQAERAARSAKIGLWSACP